MRLDEDASAVPDPIVAIEVSAGRADAATAMPAVR
jgi:hypothetical protein